jgi:UDP-glucose 4-epimerase
MNVLDLTDIVVEELSLKGVRYRTTGDEPGLIGDSPFVHLDTAEVPSSRNLAEQPKVCIEKGTCSTVRYLQA